MIGVGAEPSFDARRIAGALERRFTRAEYARRAYRLFRRAVSLARASRRGRIGAHAADAAVSAFCEYVAVAGAPRRLAMRIRPGRRERT